MKKLLIIPAILFFNGCVNNQHIDKQIKNNSKDMKLLNEYHTTKNNLHKLGDDFIFLTLNTNGELTFYKIDKDYNFISSKKLNLVINPIKVKVKNDKVYVLAYSETKNRPIFLILDKNGNIKQKFLIGKKFNTPRDFLIQQDKIFIGVNSYSPNNGTDIVIYENSTPHTFSSKYSEELTTILPYQNGYIMIGDISKHTQDILISYLDKNLKPIWTREIDFGLEESVKDVKIENDKIILNIISQNYTGMEQYYKIEIDKNGKIVNKNKKFEIKNYPLKFQG